MKHTFRVSAYRNVRFEGTLDACIKKARQLNKKEFNANICEIEIWELAENGEGFWVACVPDFWS